VTEVRRSQGASSVSSRKRYLGPSNQNLVVCPRSRVGLSDVTNRGLEFAPMKIRDFSELAKIEERCEPDL